MDLDEIASALRYLDVNTSDTRLDTVTVPTARSTGSDSADADATAADTADLLSAMTRLSLHRTSPMTLPSFPAPLPSLGGALSLPVTFHRVADAPVQITYFIYAGTFTYGFPFLGLWRELEERGIVLTYSVMRDVMNRALNEMAELVDGVDTARSLREQDEVVRQRMRSVLRYAAQFLRYGRTAQGLERQVRESEELRVVLREEMRERESVGESERSEDKGEEATRLD